MIFGQGASKDVGEDVVIDLEAGVDRDHLSAMFDSKDHIQLESFGFLPGLVKGLQSNTDRGLPPNLTEHHRELYGENRLPKLDFKSFWQLAWEVIQDKTLILLICAALISLVIGMIHEGPEKGWADGFAVIVAVALVVLITT